MKKLLFLALFGVSAQADINALHYLEADFQQKIIDDQNKTIVYNGHVKAAKPQFALWEYQSPVSKQVYILPYEVVIVEPELEQAIVKKIGDNFDFFSLIKHAKKIDDNHYIAYFKEKNYFIVMNGDRLVSIKYKDDFDNSVIIDFKDVRVNKKIEKEAFAPHIPDDYDLIKE